jgi:putative peptidoglycan lipid II flippase
MALESPPAEPKPNRLHRLLQLLRPSHQHSAFSATLLLMGAVMASRVIGYVREAYIAYAYVAAFTLPDWLNYLVAGGTASITFISIFTRYLSQRREAEAAKTFSVIITVMTTVLSVGVLLVAIYARPIERLIFPQFTPQQLELCVFLTRILLPAQIFFYVGGVVSAVLLSRRMFLIPALGPLLYNVFIILGGLLLGGRMGVGGLAVGAVAGAFTGPFLVNAIGAARTGIRYRLNFDVRDPAFREWVKLSIPLMLGVSLATADDWILRYFASGEIGAITRLNYAKRLIAVPIAVLGQAAGQASLPFFARLWGENRLREFATSVNGSIYRISAASFLASAWMMAAALPIVDLVYRRGRFDLSDAHQTAVFFFWFAISLAFWSAQALYSRAFYAAGNTLVPMLAATVVTVLSLPVYWWLFHSFSTTGLAIASDVGIAANTLVLAVLLHRQKVVSLRELPWTELGKAFITAVLAGALAYRVSATVSVSGSQKQSLAALGLATLTWAAAVAVGLWFTRSRLLSDLRRRKPQPPAAAEATRLGIRMEP